MIINKRYNLIKIIYNDLRIYGKVQLFLLLSIIISAISVIMITYHTRSIIIDREQFLLEKDYLERERNNLIFEEEILSNHARIERIAIGELQMHYIDPRIK